MQQETTENQASTTQIELVRKLVHQLARHGGVHGMPGDDGTELSFMAIIDETPKGTKTLSPDVKIVLARPESNEQGASITETEYYLFPNNAVRKQVIKVKHLPDDAELGAGIAADMPTIDLDNTDIADFDAFRIAKPQTSSVVSAAEVHNLLERINAAGKANHVIGS